jgi:hypothetical protein
MTLEQLRAAAAARLQAAITERQRHQDALVALRGRVNDGDAEVTEAMVTEAITARDGAAARMQAAESEVSALDAEIAEERRVQDLQSRTTPTDVNRPAYDQAARVGAEERTYAPHRERGFERLDGQGRAQWRRGAQPGGGFLTDVARTFLGDREASERLARHDVEERAERGREVSVANERAVGVGAFSGIVVPQYLTELYAEMPTTGRPFADLCTPHDLPATGMTAYIGRVTTGTSVADQAAEGDEVSETDTDDTLLEVSIRTAAGQQKISRQAIMRGVGVEGTVLGDLYRRYATNIDSKLLNVATHGLTNIATAVAYTDGTPTGAEFYPKLLKAQSDAATALLDAATGLPVTLMHLRRWFWLQAQMTSTWPLIGQPGIGAQSAGQNYATRYGAGYAGVLPNGSAVVLDNNIATNLGTGTNEDEAYTLDPGECHLWEDSSAPMLIRAEEALSNKLQVQLVVFGFYAFTHARVPHVQKVGGTGMVTPSF